jgi:hypothetical protein
MAHLTTGHTSPKKTAVKRGKAMHMSITRAKNGFSVSTRHEMPASSKQQAMSGLYENAHEETVHNSVASLKKHVAEKFGDLDSNEGLEGPDKGDAAERASVPMG